VTFAHRWCKVNPACSVGSRACRVVCSRRPLVSNGHVTCEWCSGGSVTGRGYVSARGLVFARQFPSRRGGRPSWCAWQRSNCLGTAFAAHPQCFPAAPGRARQSRARIHSLYTRSSMRTVVRKFNTPLSIGTDVRSNKRSQTTFRRPLVVRI